MTFIIHYTENDRENCWEKQLTIHVERWRAAALEVEELENSFSETTFSVSKIELVP